MRKSHFSCHLHGDTRSLHCNTEISITKHSGTEYHSLTPESLYSEKRMKQFVLSLYLEVCLAVSSYFNKLIKFPRSRIKHLDAGANCSVPPSCQCSRSSSRCWTSIRIAPFGFASILSCVHFRPCEARSCWPAINKHRS